MDWGEGLLADDMRLILKILDALNDGSCDIESDMRFVGTVLVQDGEALKGVINTDEDGAIYVPAVCRDCVPVVKEESDGAK